MIREPRPSHRGVACSVRLTVTFLLISAVWIIVSDRAVEWMFPESTPHGFVQTIKGLLYVLITSGLVFWLSRKAFSNIARTATELQVQKTEELLQAVMANLGEAVLMVDPSTRSIIHCNAAVETVFGYAPDELTGKTTKVLYQDQEAFESFMQKGEPELEQHGVFRCEQPLRHKNGNILQTEIAVVTLQKDLGWHAGIVCIVRDITAHRETESALRLSESRYRLLAEHTLDIIWAMNPDLVFTYVNPAIEKVTGYTPSEFIGTHLQQHIGPAALEKLEQVIHEEFSKGPDGDGVAIEIDMLRKDGSSVASEVHGKTLFDDSGEPIAIQGTTRDISHRRALEAELRQSQKLQAIGTFAGGVVHEINNPIMGISGYTELIAESAPDDPKTREYCKEIQKETGRIHSLIKDLLGYARIDENLPPEPADLREIVESTLSLVRTIIRHDKIILNPDIPDDLPGICCRRQQIQQVVMNLVTNARNALNSKYPGSDDNKRLLISCQTIAKSGQKWVRLSVEDRGTGISDDVRQRMFDPFFTTKPEGKGTGLGMWIVYRIVHDHGGAIGVDTRKGEFTRFNVDLPII